MIYYNTCYRPFTAKHPWLDLCLSTYTVKTDGGPNRVCYQVCQTSTTATPP